MPVDAPWVGTPRVTASKPVMQISAQDKPIRVAARKAFLMPGMGLPQPKIEVSALYDEYKNRQRLPYQQGADIDLRFATMMRELGLPERAAHHALNDAVMAALAFIKLRHLLAA